ncbi:hypothetical protein QFC24_001820 [Naganishia onofrii]|uniref:Uncharacterized protein n=1 Tax=Naganishia onofrii TaxID=1851511 RepID=A0ACC2XRY6_9TREE|nr:hypothetical protein QFC24_001820 [Naganishia onofrii]
MASRTSIFRSFWRQVAASATRPHIAIRGSALTTGVVLAYYLHDRQLIIPERLTVHADSERTSPILDLSKAKDAFVVDPATSISFPQTLKSLTLPGSSLSLVGLGVRTVSFLRVKVYSAGFYLDEPTLQSLSKQAEWKSFTADRLVKAGSQAEGELVGEELMEKLLSQPINCAIRIVPTRNTDFGHLRDGFTRALLARQKRAAQDGKIKPEDEEVTVNPCVAVECILGADDPRYHVRQQRIDASIQKFKSFFPSSSVPKGKELLLVKTAQNSLAVEFEGKTLGTLQDAWVATEMMVAYFANKNVISAPLKEDVARNLESTIRG